MKRTIFALMLCMLFSATTIVANPTLDNVVSDQIVLVDDLSTDVSVDADGLNEVSQTCNLIALEGDESVPIVLQDDSYTTFTFTFESFSNSFTSAIATDTFLGHCLTKHLIKPVATSTTNKTPTSGFLIQDYPVPIKS